MISRDLLLSKLERLTACDPLDVWKPEGLRDLAAAMQYFGHVTNAYTDMELLTANSDAMHNAGYADPAIVLKRIGRNLRSSYPKTTSVMLFQAIIFSSGGYITSAGVDYLTASDAIQPQISGAVRGISPQVQRQIGMVAHGDIAFTTELAQAVMEEVGFTEEQEQLAEAFSKQLCDAARSTGRAPLVGEFVLHKPFDIAEIDAWDFDHVRLIVTDKGLWISFVYRTYTALAWWSPTFDNLPLMAPPREAIILRVFCASLWHDFVVAREKAYTPHHNKWRTPEEREPDRRDLPPGQKTIVLPRNVKHIVWAEGDRHAWDEAAGLRTDYTVRGHYRKIGHLGWESSESARSLAEANGFPPPPTGWTFVHPYDVGHPEAEKRARVVCRGWQVAKVTLSRM